MADLERLYNFVDGTPAVADQVDGEFNTIVDFINDEVVHRDGSIAFMNIPSGPAENPTTNNQLARKRYVDKKAGGLTAARRKSKNGGGDALLVASIAPDTWSDPIDNLTVTFTEEQGCFYRATLFVPEIYTNKYQAFGTAPSVGGGIFRENVEKMHGYVDHFSESLGQHMNIVVTYQATVDASATWTVKFRHRWTDDAAIRYRATANAPMTFEIEDVGYTE